MTPILAPLLLTALFFHLVAAIGVLRLPDFYTRLHAVSKAETLGTILTLTALILWVGPSLLAVKLGFVAVFLFLAHPTSTHALARAALRTGVRPWLRQPAEAPQEAQRRA